MATRTKCGSSTLPAKLPATQKLFVLFSIATSSANTRASWRVLLKMMLTVVDHAIPLLPHRTASVLEVISVGLDVVVILVWSETGPGTTESRTRTAAAKAVRGNSGNCAVCAIPSINALVYTFGVLPSHLKFDRLSCTLSPQVRVPLLLDDGTSASFSIRLVSFFLTYSCAS